jgi:hypothetical protein
MQTKELQGIIKHTADCKSSNRQWNAPANRYQTTYDKEEKK